MAARRNCVAPSRFGRPVGYMPNFGGHHDCVIIPRNNDELIHSRCTTV